MTPILFPDKEGDPVHFWPGPAGAKEWTHACYSPKTELLYVPVQDVGATATRRRREFKESIPYWGAGVAVDGDDQSGYVSAYYPRTGQERWRWTNDPVHVLVAACHGRRPRVRRRAERGVQRVERPAPETCCGSSSAAAATTATRRRTASTDGSTSSRRAAGAVGPKASCPRCSARPTGARCSPSRCRSSGPVLPRFQDPRQRRPGRRRRVANSPRPVGLPRSADRLFSRARRGRLMRAASSTSMRTP